MKKMNLYSVKHAMGEDQKVLILKKNSMLEYEGTVGDLFKYRTELVNKKYEEMKEQNKTFIFKLLK